MKSSAWAEAAAQASRSRSICSGGRPKAMFAAIEASARKMVWGTWARWRCQAGRRSIERSGCSRGSPSTQISPRLGDSSPISRSKRVLLPLPVAPTRPIHSPGRMVRSIPWSTATPPWWQKSTWRNSRPCSNGRASGWARGEAGCDTSRGSDRCSSSSRPPASTSR